MSNAPNATVAWRLALLNVLSNGERVSPRGKVTLELAHHTTVVDLTEPVVASPERKLSYVYLAAEALWVLTGDDRVETITPYNPRIAEFSDDGATFYGAYGPRIAEQLGYVVGRLAADPETRQAVLTTWRPVPPATRDVPCTVALAFALRAERLNAHVFMRSSDLWLGWPYDVFTFAMVTALVCQRLNLRLGSPAARPGVLYLTAASSHLYELDQAAARTCAGETETLGTEPLPALLFDGHPSREADLRRDLASCRDRTEALVPPVWRIRPGRAP